MNRRQFLHGGIGTALGTGVMRTGVMRTGPVLSQDNARELFPGVQHRVFLNAAGGTPLGTFAEAGLRRFEDSWRQGHGPRLGAVLDTDRPKLRRHYPGYLSQSDCVQMIDKCLGAPESLRYDTFDALSNNRWRWRDTTHAQEVLGWKPTGSADDFTL